MKGQMLVLRSCWSVGIRGEISQAIWLTVHITLTNCTHRLTKSTMWRSSQLSIPKCDSRFSLVVECFCQIEFAICHINEDRVCNFRGQWPAFGRDCSVTLCTFFYTSILCHHGGIEFTTLSLIRSMWEIFSAGSGNTVNSFLLLLEWFMT